MKKYYYGFLILAYSFQCFAQENIGCDNTVEACLDTPKGLLAGSAKATAATNTLTWIISGVALVGTVGFMINAGKKLNEQDFMGAIGPFVGSCVCGLSTYISYSILS